MWALLFFVVVIVVFVVSQNKRGSMTRLGLTNVMLWKYPWWTLIRILELYDVLCKKWTHTQLTVTDLHDYKSSAQRSIETHIVHQ